MVTRSWLLMPTELIVSITTLHHTFTVENQDPFQAKANVSSVMPNILATETGVLKLFSSLDTKKSMGPDSLSPVVLKEASNFNSAIFRVV